MGPTADKWVKRTAKLALLLCAAAGAGMGAAHALGPFATRTPGVAPTLPDRVERYALGRDLIADEAARPTVRYAAYEPGARRIAYSKVPGARPLDPFSPTRTKERKARNVGADGNQYADGLDADLSYLTVDPPEARGSRYYEDAPDSRLGSRDMESALAR